MTQTSQPLESFLNRIADGLSRLGRSTAVQSLQRGVTGETTAEVLSAVGLEASDEITELYRWRNGLAPDAQLPLGELWIVPGFFLSSVQDVVLDYRACAQDSRWDPNWIPVMPSGGGDFLLVDQGPASHGAVRHFRIDEVECPIEFTSLTLMFQTYAAAFDEGVIFATDDGYLEQDDDAFAVLAARYNPGVSWWVD